MNYYFLKNEKGIVNGFIGLVRDVTERENAVNELIKSKEKAEKDLQQMCEQLLANPVIESFKYEVQE